MLRWTNVTKINGGNAIIKKEHCTIYNIIQNKNKNQVLESNVPKHSVKFGSKICKQFYQNDPENINEKKKDIIYWAMCWGQQESVSHNIGKEKCCYSIRRGGQNLRICCNEVADCIYFQHLEIKNENSTSFVSPNPITIQNG